MYKNGREGGSEHLILILLQIYEKMPVLINWEYLLLHGIHKLCFQEHCLSKFSANLKNFSSNILFLNNFKQIKVIQFVCIILKIKCACIQV